MMVEAPVKAGGLMRTAPLGGLNGLGVDCRCGAANVAAVRRADDCKREVEGRSEVHSGEARRRRMLDDMLN